ncbi:glycosyltransferase [Nocardioides montaniterrae]
MTAVMALADASPELEHHLVIWPRRDHDDNGDSLVAHFSSVHRLVPSLGLARRGLRRLVADQRPDVLHAHSSFAGVLARSIDTGTTKVAYSPHCFGFERRDVGRGARAGIRAAERALARRTDLLVACSPHEAELARANGYRAVAYVPNRALRPPTRRAVRSAEQKVVTVGRIGPQKDWAWFLQVHREYRRREPQGGTWTWIGGGDPQGVAALTAAGIEVTGWLPRDEVVRRLVDATTYVHTAAWEAAPISVLEAAEVGLPIAARAIGSLVSLGVPGLGVAPTDLATTVLSHALPDRWQAAHGASLAFASAHSSADQRTRLRSAYDALLMTS